MNSLPTSPRPHFSRRMFLKAASGTAAGLSLNSHQLFGSLATAQQTGQTKRPAIVRAAFIYPPTASLRKVGYYSWPGSTFDAEGRQAQYTSKLKAIEEGFKEGFPDCREEFFKSAEWKEKYKKTM